MDEKLSGLKLEEETADAFNGCTCVFTVVPDPLSAIECTEHTAYNMIFVAEDSQLGLSASGLLKSLRMVGATLPVVLLQDGSDASEELAAHVPHEEEAEESSPVGTGIHHNLEGGSDGDAADTEKFASCLKKPFTKRDLCDVIRSTLFPQFHRIGGEFSSINTDEEYRLNTDEMSESTDHNAYSMQFAVSN